MSQTQPHADDARHSAYALLTCFWQRLYLGCYFCFPWVDCSYRQLFDWLHTVVFILTLLERFPLNNTFKRHKRKKKQRSNRRIIKSNRLHKRCSAHSNNCIIRHDNWFNDGVFPNIVRYGNGTRKIQDWGNYRNQISEWKIQDRKIRDQKMKAKHWTDTSAV